MPKPTRYIIGNWDAPHYFFDWILRDINKGKADRLQLEAAGHNIYEMDELIIILTQMLNPPYKVVSRTEEDFKPGMPKTVCVLERGDGK